MKLLSRAVASLLLLCLTVSAADAHESDVGGGLSVVGLHASPARSGGFSTVELSVENDGIERIVLVGLRVGSLPTAPILGDVGGRLTAVESIGLDPADDREDGPVRLRFRLGPLPRDLAPGSVLPGELLTTAGSLSLSISVTDGDQAGEETAGPGLRPVEHECEPTG